MHIIVKEVYVEKYVLYTLLTKLLELYLWHGPQPHIESALTISKGQLTVKLTISHLHHHQWCVPHFRQGNGVSESAHCLCTVNQKVILG
jgi:hypothetical protein